MLGNFLTRKFKTLSIFLIRHRHNINLFHLLNLANIILSPNPNEASRLLLFLFQLPLFLVSDSDILLPGLIDFTKSLKNRDSSWTCSSVEKNMSCSWGVKTRSFVAWALRTLPSCDTWSASDTSAWNDAFKTPPSWGMFICLLASSKPLLLLPFFLLRDCAWRWSIRRGCFYRII